LPVREIELDQSSVIGMTTSIEDRVTPTTVTSVMV
jgi:hypothetical protein